MPDRAEIERLLNQTGRTLEGLPEDYGDKKLELWNSFRDKTFGHIKSFDMANRILHQSDVIELLVGALRDALDKPMQKPLTKREFRTLMFADEDVAVYCEAKGDTHAYATILFDGNSVDREGDICDDDDLVWHSYGVEWRAWATRPTDEERSTAAWEN